MPKFTPGSKSTLSLFLLLLSAGVLTLMIFFFYPPLISSLVKIQNKNLSDAYPTFQKFRPIKPLSISPPQSINYTNQRTNTTISLPPAGELDSTHLQNCTINLSSATRLNNNYIGDSTLNLSGTNIAVINSVLDNVQINIGSNSLARILNTTIQNNTRPIHITQARLSIENSRFQNSNANPLFQISGRSEVKAINSEFKNNNGTIFLTQQQEVTDAEGKITRLVPRLLIDHSLFDSNHQTSILLAEINQMGTKIANNIFTGGTLPYIEITDSKSNPYITIENNSFTNQGIGIRNSNHIIIWANKFSQINDYGVKIVDSNLIAFQYNLFENISPAAVFSQNTPQIELVENILKNTAQEIVFEPVSKGKDRP